jgi:hypothetical protein
LIVVAKNSKLQTTQRYLPTTEVSADVPSGVCSSYDEDIAAVLQEIGRLRKDNRAVPTGQNGLRDCGENAAMA